MINNKVKKPGFAGVNSFPGSAWERTPEALPPGYYSFPGSAWERTPEALPPSGPAVFHWRQSLPSCVPSQRLGTRIETRFNSFPGSAWERTPEALPPGGPAVFHWRQSLPRFVPSQRLGTSVRCEFQVGPLSFTGGRASQGAFPARDWKRALGATAAPTLLPETLGITEFVNADAIALGLPARPGFKPRADS